METTKIFSTTNQIGQNCSNLKGTIMYPAMVAWSVERLLHKKYHLPAVVRIPLGTMIYMLNDTPTFFEDGGRCVRSRCKPSPQTCVMGSWFIHGLREIEERLYEHCLQACCNHNEIILGAPSGDGDVICIMCSVLQELCPVHKNDYKDCELLMSIEE